MMGGGLRRPKAMVIGIDVAGQVQAVGKDATQFKPGDEVFGFRRRLCRVRGRKGE